MRILDQVEVISDKDRGLLQKLKQIIHEHIPSAEIILYGSVARGGQSLESDYDILVLTNEPLSKGEERKIDDSIFDLELATGSVICTMFCSREQWNTPLYCAMPFHWEVDRDAVLI